MTTFTAQDAVGAYRLETGGFDEGDESTDASGDLSTFGRNVTVDTFEGTNNSTELFEFGSRLPTQVKEQNFEGSFSVGFVLSSFEFLEIFDSQTTDTDGDNNDEYDFDEPQTFEMVVNRQDSDISRVATGCIPQSLELDSQTDGLVEVTIDGIYANEYKRTGKTLTQPTVPDDKNAINFADTTLSYDGGTLDLPRGVTISLENNMTLLSVLDKRTAGDFTVGSLTGTVDITHAVEVDETTSLEDMYGASSSVSQDGCSIDDDTAIEVTFDNGCASGSGQVKAVFTMAGFTESYSESGIDVEEDFIEADLSETLTAFEIEVTED